MSTGNDRDVGPVTASELWRMATALPGWDVEACEAVARCVTALCSTRAEVTVRGPTRVAETSGRAADDLVVTLTRRDGGAECAWLELEAPLARALVDLALGGTADTADLAHVEPLDATRVGVLLYMVACALAAVPQDTLRIAGIRTAREVPRPARIACTARVALHGRVYGAQLTVDPMALPALTEPSTSLRTAGSVPTWARKASCLVTLELARGSLEQGTLAALEPGDVVIPDAVLADPGPWETAALRCDAFDRALARVRRDADGTLQLTPAGHDVDLLEIVGRSRATFTVDAARTQATLEDVARWFEAGRLPWDVDSHAPLTLWSQGVAMARGRFVRDGNDVGLCVEHVSASDIDTRVT